MIVQSRYMAIGPLDELKTRLTLEGDFVTKGKEAKKVAEDLGGAVEDLTERIEKLDQENQQLTEEMSKQSEAMQAGAKGIQQHFRDALHQGLSAIPVFQMFNRTSATLAQSLGTALAQGIQRVIAFLATPQGLVAALAAASAAMVAFAYGSGVLLGALQSLLPVIAAITSGVGAGFGAALSIPFIKASAEMDRYKRQFTAIFGGQQQGEMATKWMQQYGLKSALSQGNLAQLIRVLGQGGQDVGRFLPVAETLAMAGREDPDTNARDIASIIMRLIGGQTADAFGPEGLGRFGISKKMLEGAGAKFDKGGSFLGDTDEAMRVLEKLTQTHPVLKDLRALMEDSTDTRLSNAWDAVSLAIQEVGSFLKTLFLPVIEQAAEWMRNFTQAGGLQKLMEGFTQMVGGADGVLRAFEGLKPIIAIAIAFVMNIPRIFDATLTAAKKIGSMLFDVFEAALNVISLVNPVVRLAAEAAKMGIRHGRQAMDAAGGFATGVMDWITEGNFSKDVANAYTMLDGKGAEGKDATLPTVPGTPTDPQSEANTEHLAAIEKNTRQLVEAQRIILGGGELGRLGVTAVDVYGKGASGSRYGSGSVGHRLTSAIYDAFDEYMAGMRRAGA